MNSGLLDRDIIQIEYIPGEKKFEPIELFKLQLGQVPCHYDVTTHRNEFTIFLFQLSRYKGIPKFVWM